MNYDSDLVVYDGADCTSLVLLGCNDDEPGCAEYSSRVIVPVLESGLYLIRVGGWREGVVGSGELTVELQ